ncbi:PLDc N-terminal domain-containing protein [Paucihalobacter sp.]|uniref:PLDc N-terminal domain-containing protein n=1 Tax=Paucihalobacter sp. TaxID=2850405 RepID=UPI002FDFFCEF
MDFITPGPGLIIVTIIFFLFLLLPFLALISIVKNKFPDNDKLVWVLIVLLLPVLGAVLYFILGRGKQLKSQL